MSASKATDWSKVQEKDLSKWQDPEALLLAQGFIRRIQSLPLDFWPEWVGAKRRLQPDWHFDFCGDLMVVRCSVWVVGKHIEYTKVFTKQDLIFRGDLAISVFFKDELRRYFLYRLDSLIGCHKSGSLAVRHER